MKREIEIDAARGLMLVWMTLTHLPTAITPWSNQPFGYFSSSDGFIFLSALLTGRIYYRLLKRSGVRSMNTKLMLRALRLYGYHLMLLFVAFTVAARYAIGAHGQGLYNLLDFYFTAGPAHAMRDALLLIYRPPLLDIIPLYIIFLMVTPAIVVAGLRVGWKFVLGGSLAVWLMAQLGLREAAYLFLAHHAGLRIPLNEMGAFNLWAWQLLWVLGLWCGVRWAKDDLPAEQWARRLWIPAAAVVAALFVLRCEQQMFGLNLDHYAILIDKWHLGLLRLIDFSAVAMLLIRFRSFTKALAVRPLVLLGQSSLQVFCMHFIFCFVGIGMMGSADRIYGWSQVGLTVATFAGLFVVAKLYARPELSAAGSNGVRKPTSSLAEVPETELTRAA